MIDFKQYFRENFFYDLKAGLITGVVALPLAIAFAIASGVSPVMGMYTAIIAGILGSGFGGSSFSITGPTGAMSVIILSTVQKYGLEGLLLAGFIAGILQIIFGLLKFGQLVSFMPLPIISGFTSGIGIIIFIGQIPNAFGLSIPAKEHIWESIYAIWISLTGGNANLTAMMICAMTIIILIELPLFLAKAKILKAIPATMIALILTTGLTIYLGLNIPQVGSIPSGIPNFKLISLNLQLAQSIFPAALTIALLGSIEALLCAVVCDAMTNTKHKSDRELVSQGIANIILPFFNGIPATAAVARSAVNVREGAKTRMSGIIHGIFLLAVLLFIGPIAMHIPKAFLAGVLMFVSARMINFHELRIIAKISRPDTLVLLLTLFLTVFTDLVNAVQIGMILAVFILFLQLTKTLEVNDMKTHEGNNWILKQVERDPHLRNNITIYTINGPFFFGAMSIFDRKIEEQIKSQSENIILRMRNVPLIDSTGIIRLIDFVKLMKKRGKNVFITGMRPEVLQKLMANKEFVDEIKNEHVFYGTKEAVAYIKENILRRYYENNSDKFTENDVY
jgi:sulfate permease, SulP family